MLYRWSITYILVILLVAVTAAAGWFSFTTWKAGERVAELEAAQRAQKIEHDKLRAQLRDVKSQALKANAETTIGAVLRQEMAPPTLERGSQINEAALPKTAQPEHLDRSQPEPAEPENVSVIEKNGQSAPSGFLTGLSKSAGQIPSTPATATPQSTDVTPAP